MKLYSNQLNVLIDKISNNTIGAILFHGPNAGLAHSLLAQIIKRFNFLITNISYKEAKTELLNQKAFEANFFNQKELIKITEITPAINKDLKEFLDGGPFTNLFCFLADDSLPPSGVRKFFEDSQSLVSIACYYDDEQAVSKTAIKKISSAGKTIEEDALFFLKNHLKGDHRIIENEIDKLINYCHDKRTVSKEDVLAAISSELMASGDEMCIYFASGEHKLFLKEITKLKEQNINEVLMIRALIRFYINLFIVLTQIEDGKNIDSAIKKISPPIFYKYIPGFKDITKKISSTDAMKIISKLNQAEVEYKQNPHSFNLHTFLCN